MVRPIEILLADDSYEDIELTQEALNWNGISSILHTVENGEECLQFLRKVGPYKDTPVPDILLLDLNMPKKGGREVLYEIKSDENLMHIPVIVLTTSKAEKDIIESYNNHANCFITKPVDFDSFVSVIREIEQFWFKTVKLPSS